MTDAAPKKKRGGNKRPRVMVWKAWRRHPITQRLFQISAPTEAARTAYLHAIDTIRQEYRLGMRSKESLERAFLRIQHGEITLERATYSYIAQASLASNTKTRTEAFLNSLEPEMRAKSVDELDIATVSAWLERLAGPPRRLIGSSRQLQWWTLSAIVHHAAERGWITAAPWGTWSPKFRDLATGHPGREALRTVDELVRLLAAAREIDAEIDGRTRHRPRVPSGLQAKIAIACVAGLRAGELIALLWSDIDEENATITIARQGATYAYTKTKRVHVIRVVPELFIMLGAYKERLIKAKLYAAKGPVFPSPETSTPGRPRPWSGACLSTEHLKRAVTKAELPHPERWTPHSLKDSFATLEQKTYGHDLRALRDRTRHASLKGLVRYLHSRSREPAAPGFALPAAGLLAPAPVQLRLLPEAPTSSAENTTTAPTEVSAVEGARR